MSYETLPPPLHVLANTVGTSQKTITRLFLADTGMGYQQWRFLKSVEMLGHAHNLSSVALDLGFASDSAFVTFFKKWLVQRRAGL